MSESLNDFDIESMAGSSRASTRNVLNCLSAKFGLIVGADNPLTPWQLEHRAALFFPALILSADAPVRMTDIAINSHILFIDFPHATSLIQLYLDLQKKSNNYFSKYILWWVVYV